MKKLACPGFLILTLFLISCAPDQKRNTPENTDSEKPNEKIVTVAAPAQKTDTINITAIKLLADYINNEVKADRDYKGKTLRVTGSVQDIKKGLTDNIFIILDGNRHLRAIQCFVADEETAGKLLKGEQVTVSGICDGLMANVLLMNATIEKYPD